jgi:3-hydroxybutyryl-CoA dehydrogenase
MDLVGVDANLAMSRVLYEALGHPEHLKPSEVQMQLVAKRQLGRKSACGFYIYSESSQTEINPLLREILPGLGSQPMAAEDIFSEVMDSVVSEARQAALDKVASEKDIDVAMKLGLDWPKGPLEWKEEFLRRS